MKISKDAFEKIGKELNLNHEVLQEFWEKLKNNESKSTLFAKTLFYLGALVVISAMTWFMNVSWDRFGGGGIFLIASLYAFAFTFAGAYLWNKKGLKTAGGLMITMAVCMMPLAIFGLQTYFHLWQYEPTYSQSFFYRVQQNWIFMEVGTIIAAIAALRFFPFPFLTAPLFLALWSFSLDMLPFILKRPIFWRAQCFISLLFGFTLLIVGLIIDKKKKEDFGFWSYLFGTISFWAGLNCLLWERGEFALVGYLLINLFMMLLSILARRSVLMIFGGIGLFLYLGHLADELFRDSLLFPFVLSFIGLFIIYLGIVYQRNIPKIEKKIPQKVRDFFGHVN